MVANNYLLLPCSAQLSPHFQIPSDATGYTVYPIHKRTPCTSLPTRAGAGKVALSLRSETLATLTTVRTLLNVVSTALISLDLMASHLTPFSPLGKLGKLADLAIYFACVNFFLFV